LVTRVPGQLHRGASDRTTDGKVAWLPDAAIGTLATIGRFRGDARVKNGTRTAVTLRATWCTGVINSSRFPAKKLITAAIR
jgi:hypothetical protein